MFVEAIPLGATGKMLKTRLREQFRELQAADRMSHARPNRAAALPCAWPPVFLQAIAA